MSLVKKYGGTMEDYINNFNICNECETANESFSCFKCGNCVGSELHCHVDNKCVNFITDCEEHWAQCDDNSHHDECACQSSGE